MHTLCSFQGILLHLHCSKIYFWPNQTTSPLYLQPLYIQAPSIIKQLLNLHLALLLALAHCISHCITIQSCFLGVADVFLTMVEGTRRSIHSPAELKLGHSKQNDLLCQSLPFYRLKIKLGAVVAIYATSLCVWALKCQTLRNFEWLHSSKAKYWPTNWTGARLISALNAVASCFPLWLRYVALCSVAAKFLLRLLCIIIHAFPHWLSISRDKECVSMSR